MVRVTALVEHGNYLAAAHLQELVLPVGERPPAVGADEKRV